MRFFAALKTHADGTQTLVRREYDSDDESYVTIVEKSHNADRPNEVTETRHYSYENHINFFSNAVFDNVTQNKR